MQKCFYVRGFTDRHYQLGTITAHACLFTLYAGVQPSN